MAKCEAKLFFNNDLDCLLRGIRMSRDSLDKSDSWFRGWKTVLGEKDRELIKKCLQNDEGSVFEHLIYQFHLKFPRSVLQELSRHRVGVSPTVKSTRYTLYEVLKEFLKVDSDYSRFMYKGSTPLGDYILDYIGNMLSDGITNDQVKKYLPEGFMSEGIYTINARALNHLFRLRNRPKVYEPFQELVQAMFEQIPDQHKFIFEKAFNNEKDSSC